MIPRDLGELRVFHTNRFPCRAVSPEHAHEAVTLKNIQTARAAHRRALRHQLNERISVVGEYLQEKSHRKKTGPPPCQRRAPKLRTDQADD